MRNRAVRRGALIAIVCALLVGCATVPQSIPLSVVAPPPLAPKVDKSVLLVLESDLKNATRTSKQFLGAIVYPLGEVLPAIIERSLGEQFKEVVTAADDSRRSGFDWVVTPKLVSFEAVVPMMAFFPTETTVRIDYVVYDVARQQARTLSGLGTLGEGARSDALLLQRLDNRMPGIRKSSQVDTQVGNWLDPAPNYTSAAGWDAMVAILHAIQDLNAQLIGIVGP